MSAIKRATSFITRGRVAALLLAFVFALAAFAGTSYRTASAGAGDAVTVIVELKGEPAAVYLARARQQGRTVSAEELQTYRAQLAAQQDRFLAALVSRGVNGALAARGVKNYDGSLAATVPLRYTLVYNGLALKVPAASVPALKTMPEVKGVRPDAMLYTQLDQSVKYVEAPRVYGAAAELSQFDDLREGYEGQGMYLAVIDTGIDWTHPMFGGDPTPPRLAVAPVSAAVPTNRKVVYYLPLTDIAAEDGFGHGTHVASTAAGYLAQHPGADGLPNTGDDIRLHGVAPQAKLMSYKVCSDIKSTVSQVQPIGGCANSDTIMALEDAMSPFTLTGQPKPVPHVINLSLGGSGGPDEPTAVACSNAALAGATVVAASGNSGPGDGTTGSPAAGRHVISVGATAHPGNSASAFKVDVVGGLQGIHANLVEGSAAVPANFQHNYVYCGVGDTPDQFPSSVRGRIALIARGSTVDADAAGTGLFANKAAQAALAGAVGVIIYNNVDGEIEGVTAYATTIPTLGISKANGEYLKSAIGSSEVGAVSAKQLRVSATGGSFEPSMAGFSSRGPVRGFGQVKPDVSAPGVAVLAAVPPASLLGAIGALEGTPNYAHVDGTSMASPHAAGAAVLVRQAHLDWTADMVRTALINTATNPRSAAGAPQQDGPVSADSIIAQGGGLINVYEAVNAKALMGVKGDGIERPGILGSHSYGEVPVVNSRVTHTATVPVTVRDLSGQGGTYNLGVANNRDLQLAGIGVALSQTSVAVPPNGEATFNVNATLDGDALRDVMAAKTYGSQVLFERLQLQWFVTARRADGGESLRMPFYFRPAASLPKSPSVETAVYTGTVLVGDYGTQLLGGVSYVDVPFEVDASTYQVEATTEWMLLPAGDQPDLDYELLDPDGNVVASSGSVTVPEYVNIRVSKPGTYTHRVIGFTNAPTDFSITTTLTKGPVSPSLQTITGEFTDAQNRQVDFDGSFTLAWQAAGGERRFEVERSADGGQTWDVIAQPAAGASSLALADQPDGELLYRVRGLHDGQVGLYVTPASAAQGVLVDRRTLVDITNAVQTAMSNVTFAGGVFQLDLSMTNATANAYLPRVELRVVGVNSASGTVRVSNADNGGAGTAASPAVFDYSNALGPDQTFAGAETTAARTLRFSDPRAELFTYDIQVTAYRRDSGAGGGAAASSSGGASVGAGGGTSQTGLLPTSLLRVAANPLTKTVSVRLVR
ncbi:MAG TPA: S8 family serine peptidase [Pyrinomonadaceae bacterium]|nr:S8 family serine peptidase [Pyrinomonadaceae bacterium]